MRILFFLLLFLFSFDSLASYKIGTGINSSCSMHPDTKGTLKNTKYRTKPEMYEAVKVVMSASTYCGGATFMSLSTWQNGKIDALIGSNGTHRYTVTFSYNGTYGCTFDDCKEIADDKCESANVDLKDFSWSPEDSGNYQMECGEPPEPEPITNNEQCTTLAQNQCFSHGGLSTSNFTNNGDSTLSCDFVCNDGSEGDKYGSKAKPPDGICNPNDPNDLADCDVADNVDPNCIFGCGDAYTPTYTPDIPYIPDGTTPAGTGNDGVTTTQGDVLINEVVNLRNSAAEQVIVSKNAVVRTLETTNTNTIVKLQEVITTIENNNNGDGDGGGAPFDDTALINSINNNANSETVNSQAVIAAIEANSLSNTSAGNPSRYGSGTFINSFLDRSEVNAKVGAAETVLKNQIDQYKTSLMSKFDLSVSGRGYNQTNLVLSQGTYDISWSRFSQYFGSIGAIIYALGSLIALSIIFQGRM